MATSTSLVQGGQISTRVKGETTCAHHKGSQLDVYCEDCLELVCVECKSTLHKTHPLCQLSEIIPRFKQDIKFFIDLNYKQDLPDNTQLKQKVQDCKTALPAGSNIEIYDARCDIHSHDQSFASSAGQGPSSTQQWPKGKKEVYCPVYTMLPETKVLGEWVFPRHIKSVCPTTNGPVWTCNWYTNTLTLMDRKGDVKQKVRHSTVIMDISLSLTTNTLWACDSEKHITELVSGQLVHRFSTNVYPQCICITDSNHVIVGMDRHISKFTAEGKSVLTSAAGLWITRKPLVCSPHMISECPVTHHVAVADWDRTNYGGEGKPHVVVMDTDFKELFVYDGEVPNTYQPTAQSGGKPFSPWGVVYDSVGNLVIGDHDNRRILLISGSGEFLRLIHTDDYLSFAVGVDSEDVLWP